MRDTPGFPWTSGEGIDLRGDKERGGGGKRKKEKKKERERFYN